MKSIKWREQYLRSKYLKAIKNKKPEFEIRKIKIKWIKRKSLGQNLEKAGVDARFVI